MNDKKKVEKHLLQQITYLTRLIEENKNILPQNCDAYKVKNPSTKKLRENNILKSKYKFLRADSPKNQSKPTSSPRQDCAECNISYTKLRVLNKKADSFHKLHVDKIKGNDINLMKDNRSPEAVGDSVNLAVKKCIHVNRKKLFENLKSNDDQSSKKCVHLNPAKLQVKYDKYEAKSTDIFYDKKLLKNVIHVNPKFNKTTSTKTKILPLIHEKSSLNSHQCSVSSDGSDCSKNCISSVMKIHFNKNFIGKNVSQDTSKVFDCSFGGLKSGIQTAKTALPDGISSDNAIEHNLPVLKSESGIKAVSVASDLGATSRASVKNSVINLDQPVIRSPVNSSENSVKIINLAKYDTENEDNFGKSQHIENIFTKNQSTKPLPVHKYKNGNRIINTNKNTTTLAKRVDNHFVINKNLCSKKYMTPRNTSFKLLYKNKQTPQRLQPVLNRSNSNSKFLKLIKLSRTKMVRAKLDFSLNVNESNVKLQNSQGKINRNSLIAKKSKSVWIAPDKNVQSNQKNKKSKSVVPYFNKQSSSYKYSARSTAVSSNDRYVKVNTPLKTTTKKISGTKSFKNQCKQNMNVSKDKCPNPSVSNQRHLQNSKLVSVSRTKLVRRLNNNSRIVSGVSRSVQKINSFPNGSTLKTQVASKLTPTLRMARSVKTKYKLIRNSNYSRSKFSWNSNNKTKGNKKGNSTSITKVNEGVSRSSSRMRRKSLTIGGIKYHTTKTKLRRKYPVKEGKICGNKMFKKNGESYRVTSGGRSLKRINSSEFRRRLANNVCKRGSRYHYNSLLRTDSAYVRVVLAKQKSIALLTKRLKKCNEPCLIFNRLGRCSGHERGVCNRLHDKKRVTICKKFLRGACENKECLLSHDVGPSKMPTCRHYLAGVCMREDCPYLHVKVNNSAPICISFLQGYCPDAGKCKKRHVATCPEYENKGTCLKGKSCPYPHPKIKSYPKGICSDNVAVGSEKMVVTDSDSEENKPEEFGETGLKSSRYYILPEYSLQSELTTSVKRICEDEVDLEENDWLRKRPKIGDLPGFIPLDAEGSPS